MSLKSRLFSSRYKKQDKKQKVSGQIGDEKKQLFRIQISRGHHWLNNGKDFEECLM